MSATLLRYNARRDKVVQDMESEIYTIHGVEDGGRIVVVDAIAS